MNGLDCEKLHDVVYMMVLVQFVHDIELIPSTVEHTLRTWKQSFIWFHFFGATTTVEANFQKAFLGVVIQTTKINRAGMAFGDHLLEGFRPHFHADEFSVHLPHPLHAPIIRCLPRGVL